MKTIDELVPQILEAESKKIKVDGPDGVKSALKAVKNASDHTKKMIKANPTEKMPHGASRHAAYSESVNSEDDGRPTHIDEKLDIKNNIHSITSASKAGNAIQTLKDKAQVSNSAIDKHQAEVALQAHKNLKQQLTNKEVKL